MAAEKLRDGEWWERTLQPLRERERAATLAAAGAATEGIGSPPQQTGMRAAVVEARRHKLAAAAEKQAAALLVDREDAELAERAHLVRLGAAGVHTTAWNWRLMCIGVTQLHLPTCHLSCVCPLMSCNPPALLPCHCRRSGAPCPPR